MTQVKVDADCDGNEFRGQFELFELALVVFGRSTCTRQDKRGYDYGSKINW